jgi:hypothetical protein
MSNLAGLPALGFKQPKAKPNPRYIAAIHIEPCCICEAFGFVQTTPTAAHHTICGRFGNRKTPDEMAIPLCWNHHQGPDGIHERRQWWVEAFGPDTDFIAPTQDKLREYL